MTVSTVETRKTYNGNGTTAEFATPYFLENADLYVYVDGVLQVETTDYTVADSGVPAGGTVTFLAAPPTGTGNVVIIRDPAQTQPTDWVENDRNPAEVKERAFDRLVMLVQRLGDRMGRAVTLGDTDTKSSLQLPALADRKSSYPFFDSNGDLTVLPVGNVYVYPDPISPFGGFRNRILNGDMRIAQMGTSFPAVANLDYTLDGWQCGSVSDAIVTVTQEADGPTDEFPYSLRTTVTTADASIDAGQFEFNEQRIEGYNVRDLLGRTFTVVFWMRSSKTGVHSVALRNSTPDRSYVAEVTIDTADTWEQKSFTVVGGLPSSGTWDWTTGIGLRLSVALAAGTTYQTATVGEWVTGNYLASPNQVNCLDTVGNIVAITGVQLEPGAIATPFDFRPIDVELLLCQRYARPAPSNFLVLSGSTTTIGARGVPLAPRMRAAPTVSISAPLSVQNYVGTTFTQSSASAGTNFSAADSLALTGVTNFTGLTANNVYHVTNGGVLFLSARL